MRRTLPVAVRLILNQKGLAVCRKFAKKKSEERGRKALLRLFRDLPDTTRSFGCGVTFTCTDREVCLRHSQLDRAPFAVLFLVGGFVSQSVLDPKLVERLKWKDKRARVQVSLEPGKKRVRLTPASSGWAIADKKARGAEINVRQLLPAGAYTRKCPASIEGDAVIIKLPDDFELKNPALIIASS